MFALRELVPSLLLLALPAVGTAQVRSADAIRIDSVFRAYTTATPGCAVAVYHRGVPAFAKGYGMADLAHGVPITPATIFDIGSTSKQFTSAAITLLALDGKLELTDDVRKFLPDLPTYGAPITIDHMLRHISGLRDYNGLLYLAGHRIEDVTDDEDAIEIINRQRNLNFAPGSRWDYSNTGFFLLSAIIKKITGQTLAEFAKERMFAPLGMRLTHFRDDHTAILANRATAYSPDERGFVIDMSNWDQMGDGAVNTNVLELGRWDANFYQPTVGGQRLIDLLQERGRLNNGDTLQYARGLFVDRYRGLRRVHHGGAWGGYRAMLMRFPDQGTSIGLTCNVANANTQAKAERVADIVLGGAFAEPLAVAPGGGQGPPSSVASADFGRYQGMYLAEPLQSTVEIITGDGSMTAKAFGSAIRIVPTGENRFTGVGPPIEFEFDPDGQSVRMQLLGDWVGPFRRVVPPEVSSAAFGLLAGTYPSPELGTSWKIAVEDGNGFLVGRNVGRVRLEPVGRDVFRAGSGLVTFTRGRGGRVDGFDYSASRMVRIRFDREPARR